MATAEATPMEVDGEKKVAEIQIPEKYWDNKITFELGNTEGKGVEMTTTIRVIKQSITVSQMLQTAIEMGDDGINPDMVIPLPQVEAKEFEKILGYCQHYSDPANVPTPIGPPRETMNDWDRKFFTYTDIREMMPLINASNYLNIPFLTDVLCKVFADDFSGKTTEEIREILGEPDDLTEEEKEEIRKENETLNGVK